MKKILSTILFLLSFFVVSASHIVGGNFDLIKIRGIQYKINLTLYFDDLNGIPTAEDQQIQIAVYDKENNALMDTRTLEQVQDVFVQYENPACALPSQIRTRKIVYTSDLILSADDYNNNDGYYIVWERCCRNGVIDNIQNPDQVGMVFYMEFPPVDKVVNSSPRFKDLPTEYLCEDQVFQLDFGATDVNGDSLAYKLYTPMRGTTSDNFGNVIHNPPYPSPTPLNYTDHPYDTVDWVPGFSRFNAIPGSPPLRVNPQTGILTGEPSNNGLFVFGVVCEEFRNGVKIGEIRREFQYLIIDCQINEKPEIQIKEIDSLSYYSPNDTITISPTDERCFRLFVSDSSDNVSMFSQNVTFNPAWLSGLPTNVNIPGKNTDSTRQFCFTDCADSEGTVHSLEIVARDDGCPVALKDTIKFTFVIEPIQNAMPEIGTTLIQKEFSLQVGEDTTFTYWGTDDDPLDQITLSGTGKGFSKGAVGMSFPTVSGNDSIFSEFYWRPDCEDYLQRKKYKLVFKVEDNSCYTDHVVYDTVTITLTDIEFDEAVFIPYNMVTPNGDGKNDCFTLPQLPLDNCIEQYKGIRIYNRWGANVFYSTDRNFSWCVEDHPDGVYYYIVDFTNTDYKGWIQLVR